MVAKLEMTMAACEFFSRNDGMNRVLVSHYFLNISSVYAVYLVILKDFHIFFFVSLFLEII